MQWKSMELYNISFKGLSLGSHAFDWKLSDSFFALYEMSDISDASIDVQLTLIKNTRFLELNFEMNGWAEVSCDRCLDPLKLDVSSKEQIIVKFDDNAGENGEEDDNDIVFLPYSEDKINVAQYLYEFAHLSLPMRRVHQDDANGKSTCNAEMISKLEQYLVKN
jgi:uncharacterized metal-binding protein YceD (DUF177 family)